MYKILAAVALLLPTPVLADTYDEAPSLCLRASKYPDMAEYILEEMKYSAPSDKLLMLRLCGMYLVGRRDQLLGK